MVVGGLGHRLVQRAAAQKKLAQVAIGDHGLQLAFRGNEQDALAGLVQFFHAVQHGGVFVNEQFLYLEQGGSTSFWVGYDTRDQRLTAPALRR